MEQVGRRAVLIDENGMTQVEDLLGRQVGFLPFGLGPATGDTPLFELDALT